MDQAENYHMSVSKSDNQVESFHICNTKEGITKYEEDEVQAEAEEYTEEEEKYDYS